MELLGSLPSRSKRQKVVVDLEQELAVGCSMHSLTALGIETIILVRRSNHNHSNNNKMCLNSKPPWRGMRQNQHMMWMIWSCQGILNWL
jgi:hypothetical protein